jgi:hypothetical protein
MFDWLRALQFDGKQAVFQRGASHLYSVRENERALELPRGNPAMQECSFRRLALLPANHELRVLYAYAEVGEIETRDRERDSQPIGSDMFDIIWRIGILSRFRGVIEQTLDMLEA